MPRPLASNRVFVAKLRERCRQTERLQVVTKRGGVLAVTLTPAELDQAYRVARHLRVPVHEILITQKQKRRKWATPPPFPK